MQGVQRQQLQQERRLKRGKQEKGSSSKVVHKTVDLGDGAMPKGLDH